MTRRREIVTVWLLLAAPVVAWVALMDFALLRNAASVDALLHIALGITLVTLCALAIGIVDTAHENWRLICRYMSVTFLIEAGILLLASRYIVGNAGLICAAVALLASVTIAFGSRRY
jgi:hypothetical protein